MRNNCTCSPFEEAFEDVFAQGLGPGGATTTGPDATPPSAICQNWGGSWGGGGGVGGRVGGGVLAAWPGGAHNPLLSHLKGVPGGMGV